MRRRRGRPQRRVPISGGRTQGECHSHRCASRGGLGPLARSRRGGDFRFKRKIARHEAPRTRHVLDSGVDFTATICPWHLLPGHPVSNCSTSPAARTCQRQGSSSLERWPSRGYRRSGLSTTSMPATSRSTREGTARRRSSSTVGTSPAERRSRGPRVDCIRGARSPASHPSESFSQRLASRFRDEALVRRGKACSLGCF